MYKIFLLLAFHLVTTQNAVSQTLTDFVGIWDGLGYKVVDGVEKPGTSRFVISPISGKPDSLNCHMYYNSLKEDLRAGFFFENMGLKGNVLYDVEDEAGGKKCISYLHFNGKGESDRLFWERYVDGKLTDIWAYTKISNSVDLGLDFSEVDNCINNSTSRVDRDNTVRGMFETVVMPQEFENPNLAACLNAQLNPNKSKYVYIKELKLLWIVNKKFLPIYLSMDELSAKKVIANPVLDFKFLAAYIYRSEDLYDPNMIFPWIVDIKISALNKSIKYPHDGLREAFSGKVFQNYLISYKPK